MEGPKGLAMFLDYKKKKKKKKKEKEKDNAKKQEMNVVKIRKVHTF